MSMVVDPGLGIEQVSGRINGMKSLRSALDSDADLQGFLILCHRVIEHHIGVLSSVSRKLGIALQTSQKRSLTDSLNFFEHIAPLHHADEEFTLFPCLKVNSIDEGVIKMLESCVIEHKKLESLHTVARILGRNWLESNELTLADGRELDNTVSAIQAIYISHLSKEEITVFKLINSALDIETQSEMFTEIRQRWISD